MQSIAETQNRELLETCRLGRMSMKNRFVVPGIARFRAHPKTCQPTPLMGQYYAQKYHNALIISEPNLISSEYNPFPGLPGLFDDSQIAPWNELIDRVHAKASNIVAQLFHPGRVVSAEQLPQGIVAKAASAQKINGQNKLAKYQPFTLPKAMTIDEIKDVVSQFKSAAQRAREAGFDGVQIEAGNGYLIDTFLRDSSNTRKDEYGGSIQNRCRLLLEIIDNVSQIHGSQWVSVKLSPTSAQYDMNDSDPQKLMTYLLSELSKRDLAFVEIRKGACYLDISPSNPTTLQTPTMDMSAPLKDDQPDFFNEMRQLYKGSLVANYDFPSIEQANDLIKKNNYQACAFDVLSISNPDIPQRVKERAHINNTVRTVFIYKGQRDGYVDYPYFIAHSKL